MSALMLVDAGADRGRGPRRRRHAVVAEPRRDPKILGASVECVQLAFGDDGWTLDVDRLLAALDAGTRAVYINSPNNPDRLDAHGGTAALDPRALPPPRHLDHRRRRLRAALLRRRRKRVPAPSFLDLAQPTIASSARTRSRSPG
jgi:hypothetical protein